MSSSHMCITASIFHTCNWHGRMWTQCSQIQWENLSIISMWHDRHDKFWGRIEYPSILDNSGTVSIMLKTIITNMKSYTNVRICFSLTMRLYIKVMAMYRVTFRLPSYWWYKCYNAVAIASLELKRYSRNMFGRDPSDQWGYWKDYTIRITYIKQIMNPLVVGKVI